MNRVVLTVLGLSIALSACSDDGADSRGETGASSGGSITGSDSDALTTGDTTPVTTSATSTPTSTDGTGSASATMGSSGTTADTATTADTVDTASDTFGTTMGTSTTDGTTGSGAVCGDGVMEGDEACDDGNVDGGDGCSASCTIEDPLCGNGKMEGAEECDDGNLDDGDGCSGICTVEACGNGKKEGAEACDDGNAVDGDGCEANCTLSCGNGKVDAAEECDGAMLPKTDCKALDPIYSGGSLSCASCFYDVSQCVKCEAPGMVLACDADAYIKGTSEDILHAMELGCNSADAMFADPNKHVPVTNWMATNVAAGSWRAIKQFGTYLDPNDGNKPLWRPRKGDRMLLISSGNLPAPNAQGVLTQAGGTISGTNANPDNLGDVPGITNWQRGSNNGAGGTPFLNCDKVNDCSDTLFAQWNLGNTKSAHDVFYVQFNVAVPKGTNGYIVDFAYFSSEYPTYVGTQYNDMAILWQVSENYTGNVTFITDGNNNPQPLSVTALAQNGLMKYVANSPQLAGTGFTTNAGTGWSTVKGPAKPEETLTLAWTVFDKADTILDTALLIDNWKWDCEGCVPSEVDSCGVQPQ